MPTIPVRTLGALGIIKDVNPFGLPPNGFSDGMNVRFDNAKVQRAPIFRLVSNTLTGTTPVFCIGQYVQSGFDSVIYANTDGRLFSVANKTELAVTEPGHVNATDPRPFTGCQLSQCIFVNRPDQVPRYLAPGATAFALIPGWDSTWRCVSLRSFRNFLIALNVTKGATPYPNLFKWSDTAPNGSAPTSWDITDTTKLAGENPISQLRTPLVDGGPLGDYFIAYSRDEVWRVEFIGGQFMFDFRRCPFDSGGLINQNCYVEIDGKHYVWGENDIYVHDGVSKTSIIDRRNRVAFFRELNIKQSAGFFIAHDKYRHEIIFCGVSGSNNASVKNPNGYCNYGAVYNYLADTWSFMDLPNVSSSSTANANTVATYYELDPVFTVQVGNTLTYDTIGGTYFDQEDSFSRACVFTSVADTANGLSVSKLSVLDDANWGKFALALDTEAVWPAWAQRTGLDLDEIGAELRGYKHVRAMMPQVSLSVPSAVLTVQIGGHEVSASTVSWDAPTPFDPSINYKVDTRRGGRYIAHQFNMAAADDFEVSGFDLDVVVTGRR